jgi:methylmalonyl-CoA mutase cobalamin-binding domain/chain
MARGLPVDDFAPRLSFFFNSHIDFFEEIAKFRAARRIYARRMRDRYGAKNPRSLQLRFHTQTAGCSLTAQQPINNVVRGTAQAMALAMAGVQAMEISTFDEAFRPPSHEAHVVALRTQQIINVETGITDAVDPLGGSYYVERLTNEMEEKIRELVSRIEATGDPAELAARGFFRNLLERAMVARAHEVEEGILPRVGVNVFSMPEEEDQLLRAVAETKVEPCWDHVERIREFKRSRDMARLGGALRALFEVGKSKEQSLMPAIIAAFDAEASLGEVAGMLRLAYGAPYDPFGAVTPPIDGGVLDARASA